MQKGRGQLLKGSTKTAKPKSQGKKVFLSLKNIKSEHQLNTKLLVGNFQKIDVI